MMIKLWVMTFSLLQVQIFQPYWSNGFPSISNTKFVTLNMTNVKWLIPSRVTTDIKLNWQWIRCHPNNLRVFTFMRIWAKGILFLLPSKTSLLWYYLSDCEVQCVQVLPSWIGALHQHWMEDSKEWLLSYCGNVYQVPV